MIAVIRIRGEVGVKKEVKDTFRMLNLEKKNRCVVLPETPQYMGMLKKVKDLATWGTVSEEVLASLIKKRGRSKHNKKLSKEFLDKNTGIIVKKIKEGKTKETEIKPYFRLNSPSKGFKGSLKNHYPKGALGNRKEKINELLERMM